MQCSQVIVKPFNRFPDDQKAEFDRILMQIGLHKSVITARDIFLNAHDST